MTDPVATLTQVHRLLERAASLVLEVKAHDHGRALHAILDAAAVVRQTRRDCERQQEVTVCR